MHDAYRESKEISSAVAAVAGFFLLLFVCLFGVGFFCCHWFWFLGRNKSIS